MQQENSEPVLYQGKAFTAWKQAFETIESRAKQQGFNIIYSRVEKKSDGTFHRRTAQCEHYGNYITKSNKETTTKRLGCTWHINLSEPTSKNPFKYVYITTLHDIHSHNLNPNIIQFGDNKYIPPAPSPFFFLSPPPSLFLLPFPFPLFSLAFPFSLSFTFTFSLSLLFSFSSSSTLPPSLFSPTPSPFPFPFSEPFFRKTMDFRCFDFGKQTEIMERWTFG
ncbi:unnamed protein product [Rhizophagus irregularis]|nr:unnamed protein product [Rhizophagus irregularis]